MKYFEKLSGKGGTKVFRQFLLVHNVRRKCFNVDTGLSMWSSSTKITFSAKLGGCPASTQGWSLVSEHRFRAIQVDQFEENVVFRPNQPRKQPRWHPGGFGQKMKIIEKGREGVQVVHKVGHQCLNIDLGLSKWTSLRKMSFIGQISPGNSPGGPRWVWSENENH